MSNECVFCNKTPIFESKYCIAVYDEFPVSKGHMLIIPKRHVADFHDLSNDEKNDMWKLESIVKEHLNTTYNPDGFNIGINVGSAAGQSIMHVHMHVIPRYIGDVENPRGGVRGVIPKKQNY